ncbi:MAG TPA: hypothetical protein ENJ82_04240 [Bacteroidetes bacterium]|nr:hypothetical protein [Bacteroidota bacterium]
MKITQLITGAAMLLMVAFSFSSANAQNCPYNEAACKTCGTEVYAVNIYPFPWNCRTFAFGASVTSYGKCEPIGYNWRTSDPNAVIVNAGGIIKVKFSGSGTYTVCCSYSSWFDANDNDMMDPNEICCDELCVTVNVCN